MSVRNSLPFFLAPFLAACSRDGNTAPLAASTGGSLVFEITDAPIDPRLVDAAVIEVDAISVHRRADGQAGFVTVYDKEEPLAIDLTTLRNGVTVPINAGFLPPGTYRQGRLVISDAFLALTNGKEYSTRDGTIDLSSQEKSGYKIFFDPPVVVEAGVQTRVLLDFQLLKTFSPVPANDLEKARWFRLHPFVRFAVLQDTGELRGVVTTTDPAGAAIPASGAAVYVLEVGDRDPDRALATTLADDDGSAAILGLEAGTYDVLAIHDGRTGRVDGLNVTPDAVTSFGIQVE